VIFGSNLGFEAAFDYYQQVVYRADDLAEDIAALLRKHDCYRVLDCAAGTGTPALQLRAILEPEGFELDCSDGDEAWSNGSGATRSSWV
jgi:hypothetical protein